MLYISLTGQNQRWGERGRLTPRFETSDHVYRALVRTLESNVGKDFFQKEINMIKRRGKVKCLMQSSHIIEARQDKNTTIRNDRNGINLPC